ncbi:MAG: hypothetical protein SPL08_05725 [Pseudomonadota bacterium]|nr:hypothetical protein [Pseudomonadota bacterium]
MSANDCEKTFKKVSARCTLLALGILAGLVAVSSVGGYLKYKRYQEERDQADQDERVDMTLIDHQKGVAPRACVGVMFFSKTGQTNQTDAVMHYATCDLNVVEKLRHLKLGEKKKVAEWKGLVTDKHMKTYSWTEIER